MWAFFSLVSIAIVAVVALLLYRFPLGNVPVSVLVVVACAWLTSISFIAFIPVDVWATRHDKNVRPIYVMWQVSFWSTQFLTWVAIPLFMGYVESGAFTTLGKIQGSIRENLLFYAILLALSFIGIMFVMAAGNLSAEALPGTCIALINMFGLTVVVFLLGYGLVSFPRQTWKLANPEAQLKQRHFDIGRLAKKVEECIAEISRVNLVVHASEQQISRRDPLRQYMDIVCMELMKTKPAGIELEKGRSLQDHLKNLTSEELDYALDLKGLTELRRRVWVAANRFEGARVEYASTVHKAMQLEEICKRRRNHDYLLIDSHSRGGSFYWYALCIISPVVRRLAAVIFGVVSLVVVWSELIIVSKRGYLSPFNLLMKSAKTEWAVYCAILFPLAYMFFCTYHTLFNLAAFKFYHLVPRASPPYSLLLNGTLMCRFAAPLAYNFLHVIQVIKDEDDDSTAFSRVMGSMRVLPFFGKKFNTLLPILLLVHCTLIFFDLWKRVHYSCIPARYRYSEEVADDEFSSKGRLLLIQEQSAKEEGKKIGEVIGIDAHHHPSTSSLKISTSRTSLDDSNSQRVSLDVPLKHVEGGGQSGGAHNNPSSRLDTFFSSLTGSSSRGLLPTSEPEPEAPPKSKWRLFQR